MKFDEILTRLKQEPFLAFFATLVIFLWLVGPFAAQKFFDISAIKVSFAIIIFYFLAWKFYEYT